MRGKGMVNWLKSLALGGMIVATGAVVADADNARWINPYIGTSGGGHCFPGPSCPFGMVQPSPDTDAETPRYNIPGGFRYEDEFIYGFSQTHLNGTGCPDLGDVRLFPVTGTVVPAKARPNGALRDDAFRSTYDKRNSVCEAGYYSVKMDNGAFAEMTAAPHVAFSRFSWPDGGAKLLVDLQWGMGGDEKRLREHLMEHASVPDLAARRILGSNIGWQWVYRETHYAIVFSHPWTAIEELPLLPLEKAPRRVLTFDLKPDEKLGVKVAFSTVSPEKALQNLEAEIAGWDFDRVRSDCRAAWNRYMSRVDVEGTDEEKAVYYTGLYHLLLQPSNIADVDGRFRGIAREGAKFRQREVYDAPNGVFYSTFSLWDTFRAAAPYMTLFAPERVPDFLNSMLKQEEICGYLPVWPLWGGDTGCMIANHAVPEFADAYLKGLRGVDWERAYSAVKRTLTRTRQGVMNTDWQQYAALGYFPCDAGRWNVSRTLEACYDDVAAARFAAALGKADDAAFFAQRAKNCWNLWDKTTGFFRGKDAAGNWRTPFKTLAQGWWKAEDGVDYCEANAWQYLFHVMQDPDALIVALGGRERFLQKLDAFFGDARELDGTPAKKVHWLKLGQYEHDNEPSHHVAYFYALAGRPERTQELVRKISSNLYTTRPNGVPGNEDCGQTSAWYLFSAMGFYPFDPCGGEYVIGAPQLPRVTIDLESGSFTVIAKNLSRENKYVKSATLNGKPVTDGKIRHADILRGGELVFEMTNSVVRSGDSEAGCRVERIFRPERHVKGNTNVFVVQEIDKAAWIWMKDAPSPDGRHTPFLRFRREFTAVEGEPLEVDISADERYVLYLDGEPISRGPHRGQVSHWYYQSYRINLKPGSHRLEAVCWQLGETHAPIAQLSWGRGGFVLKASGSYDGMLTTGKAAWKVARLGNVRMTGKGASKTYGAGSECEIRGTSFADEEPPANAWRDAVVVRKPVFDCHWGIRMPGWQLFPTALPDQMYEVKSPGRVRAGRATFASTNGYEAADAEFPAVNGLNELLDGKAAFTVPPHTEMEFVWDFGDYYCGYPELVVDGGAGARIEWGWTEGLRTEKDRKENRGEFVGKRLTVGMTDVFLPDGRTGAFFTTPWWRCGRWCRIAVKAADAPLSLTRLAIGETRYPTSPTARFECDDRELADVQRICVRGLQNCMHETFFDCPYVEQQMYPGDSRVEFLTSAALNSDPRLVRQSIAVYDYDRRSDGFVAMSFPTRGEQESATYSLCWTMMFRDYLYEHGDRAFLRAHLGGLRNCIDAFGLYEGPDGLLAGLPGWLFIDWAGFQRGQDTYGIINLQYLCALLSAADVEDFFGETLLARRLREKADRLKAAVREVYWDEEKALFADDAAHASWSEHAQCLALLGGAVSGEEADRCYAALMKGVPGMHRATVYFSFYLFEVMLSRGDTDAFLSRLGMWKKFVQTRLCTPAETPSTESRSDCHAWGSHPLYHLHRGVAGVRPLKPGFAEVLVEPKPGSLSFIRSSTPHPKGSVDLDLSFPGGAVHGSVTLPDGVSGVFRWNGAERLLSPGRNDVGTLLKK